MPFQIERYVVATGTIVEAAGVIAIVLGVAFATFDFVAPSDERRRALR